MKHYNHSVRLIAPSFVFKTIVSFTLAIGFLLYAEGNMTFAAPGDLDPTFGSGGKVINNIEGGAMALQPDGKIVVVGKTFAEFTDFAVLRYNSNGTLDTSFGSGGRVVTSVGNQNDSAQAVIIQPDGKIVVAGYTDTTGGNNFNFAVVRYNPNGTLDTTFDGDGVVTTAVGGANSSAYALALQTDGKIIAAGSRGGFAGDFAVVRYNANGSLDTAFDGDGQAVTPVGSGFDSAAAIAVQSDGKIVATGEADVGSLAKWGIVRYNADGSLDASFGTGGKILGSFRTGNDFSSSAALQADGKIIIAGGSEGAANRFDFAVARFNPNGTLDAAFDGDGIAITAVRQSSSANSVSIQSNGKIVAAGYSDDAAFNRDFAVARYNPNGSLDTGFGSGGTVVTDIANDFEIARSSAIQPDGRIVVAGEKTNGHAVVRYLGDALITRRAQFDFDGDGKTDYAVFRPSNGVWYLQQSQNGFTGVSFGQTGDKLVPADYDGDGKTDVAVYRSGVWYLQRSQAGFTGVSFGDANDVPAPADFTGDGKAELAVFRPSNGTWYLYNLAANQTSAVQFGASGDRPVPADYDGDAKADVAVFRPSAGTWYVQRSAAGFVGMAFGNPTDKPVPADYDGDGKADVAVARQSGGVTAWYVLGTTQGFYGAQFGADTDRPVAGDYDGDGKADLAVWRNSNGTFYVQRSGSNQFTAAQFGTSGDAPAAAAFVP